MFLSWVISGILGFVLGVLAGKNKGSLIDKAIRVYCYILQSAPSFWIALLVLVVFSVELGWFPVGLQYGYDCCAAWIFERLWHYRRSDIFRCAALRWGVDETDDGRSVLGCRRYSGSDYYICDCEERFQRA